MLHDSLGPTPNGDKNDKNDVFEPTVTQTARCPRADMVHQKVAQYTCIQLKALEGQKL
jgi:hypothetical protein